MNSDESRVVEIGIKEAEISDDIYSESKAIMKSFFSAVSMKKNK